MSGKDIKNIRVNVRFILITSVRIILTVSLAAALTFLLAQEGLYGVTIDYNVTARNNIKPSMFISDITEIEEIPYVNPLMEAAPAIASIAIYPDMNSAERLIEGTTSILSVFSGVDAGLSGAAGTLAYAGSDAAAPGAVAALAYTKGGVLTSADKTNIPSNGETHNDDTGKLYNGESKYGETDGHFNGETYNGVMGGHFNGDFNGYSDDSEGGFPAVRSFFSAMYAYSYDVADAHQMQLDLRADSLSYARQLSAAKYLSQSAYQAELAWRKAFIDEHGMSAADMDDKFISQRYDGNYFTERLRTLGFYKNDNYGSDVNRRNAIIRAQSAFNIPITGRIDLDMKRALIEGTDYITKDTITADDRPDGMWCVIDKSARILTVYVDDIIYHKYPVAVGKTIGLTPEGKFTFVTKAVNPRWGGGGYAQPVAGGAPNNPLGKRWLGLSIGWGGSYGVHGNVSPYSIGTYASHGCVRMINSDVEELFDYVKIGTPCWIGTTDRLREWGVYQQLGSWDPDPPDYFDYLPQSMLYEE